jgi:hypothetical protein
VTGIRGKRIRMGRKDLEELARNPPQEPPRKQRVRRPGAGGNAPNFAAQQASPAYATPTMKRCKRFTRRMATKQTTIGNAGKRIAIKSATLEL